MSLRESFATWGKETDRKWEDRPGPARSRWLRFPRPVRRASLRTPPRARSRPRSHAPADRIDAHRSENVRRISLGPANDAGETDVIALRPA